MYAGLLISGHCFLQVNTLSLYTTSNECPTNKKKKDRKRKINTHTHTHSVAQFSVPILRLRQLFSSNKKVGYITDIDHDKIHMWAI